MARHSFFTTLFYLVVGGLGRGIPVLLVIYLSAYISVSDMGAWGMLQAAILIAVPVLGGNAGFYIDKNYQALDEEQHKIAKSTYYFIQLSLAIVLAIVIGLVHDVLNLAGWMASVDLVFFVFFVTGVIIRNYFTTFYRHQRLYSKFAVTELSHVFVLVVLVFLTMEIGLGDWRVPFYSFSLSACFSLLVLYILEYRTIDVLSVKLYSYFHIIKSSYTTVIHVIGNMAILVSDRFILDFFEGKEAVGMYTLSYSFSMLVFFVADSFNKWYVPDTMKKCMKKTIDMSLIRLLVVNKWYILTALLICVLSVYIYDLLMNIKFIKSEYQELHEVILLLSTGFVIQSLYFLAYPYVISVNPGGVLSKLTAISFGINMVLNFILIPILGVLGAAVATAVAYFSQVIGAAYYMRR